MKNQIDSNLRNLDEVLVKNSKGFIIPVLQREYVWTSEEIDLLFRDFEEDSGGYKSADINKEGYLLGNVVLIDSSDGYIIVDGQQRLTTISLIYKALDNRMKKESYKENVGSGQRDYIVGKSSNLKNAYGIFEDDKFLKENIFINSKIRHDDLLLYGKGYRSLISGRNKEVDKTNKSVSLIFNAYSKINEELDELDETEIFHFMEYFREHVKLVETIAPNEAKAFQLFEALNSRGASLEPFDLLKNHFMKQISKEHSLDSATMLQFTKNWLVFNEVLDEANKAKDTKSNFMRYYILYKYGKLIKKNSLFNFFSRGKLNNSLILSNTEEILDFSEELIKIGTKYAMLIKKKYFDFSPQNEMGLRILFDTLNIKQFHALLMSFYFESEETLEKAVDLLIRYSASCFISYSQTNSIESKIEHFSKKIYTLTGNEKLSVLTEVLKEDILENSRLIPGTLESRIVKENKAKNILLFVESYILGNTAALNYSDTTVEHILARNVDVQEYSDVNFKDEDEFKNYLNRIGNLTLLQNEENSSANNKKYKDKWSIYKETHYKITNGIVGPFETSIASGSRRDEVIRLNNLNLYVEENEFGHYDKEHIKNRTANLTRIISEALIID